MENSASSLSYRLGGRTFCLAKGCGRLLGSEAGAARDDAGSEFEGQEGMGLTFKSVKKINK